MRGNRLTLGRATRRAVISGIIASLATAASGQFTKRPGRPAGYQAGFRFLSAAAAVPGLTAPSFATPPSVAYHPHSQAGAVTKSGDKVLACPDMMGLAGMTASAATAPVEMTDALGRKFWRFDTAAFAVIANTLNGYSARGYTVLLVVRHHRSLATTFFSPRYASYTDDTTNTSYAGGAIRTLQNSGSAPRLFNAAVDTSTDATNGAFMVTGSHLQVITIGSRPTASGGTRALVNNRGASVAQSGVTATSMTGGLLGGTPGSSNAVTAAGGFDLFYVGLWPAVEADAGVEGKAAAAVSHYAIPAIDTALVIEGDSISQGTGPVASGINLAMLLTQPGSPLIPANVRVTNIAVSGDTTASLITRRNAASSLASKPLPGGATKNIVAIQIGRNNWGALGQTGAQSYDQLKLVMSDATSGSEGWLQRGWTVSAVVNIAASLAACYDQRALMLSSLVSDLQAGPGQTYTGRVSLLRADLIATGGQTIFEDAADAANTTYYVGDSTHPNILGAELMASGGDTPANGYGAIL